MKKTWHATVHLALHRDMANADLVHYTLTRTWYEGDTVPREGRKYRHATIAEGTMVQREPVRDVRVLVREAAEEIYLSAHGAKPAAQAPGRERSGLAHIEPPIPYPMQELPLDTPETPEPPDPS